MDSFFYSALLVFVSEMGDKTQLLSLILMARYKQPWVILAGVLIATLANHAVAAVTGDFIGSHVSPSILRWSLGLLFVLFSVWLLIPDKQGDVRNFSKKSVFLTTLISFFLAEMGDKTQLATVAIGAKYTDALIVTLGTSAGMVLANALAVFCGESVLKRIPMQSLRWIASALFFLFGLGIIIGY